MPYAALEGEHAVVNRALPCLPSGGPHSMGESEEEGHAQVDLGHPFWTHPIDISLDFHLSGCSIRKCFPFCEGEPDFSAFVHKEHEIEKHVSWRADHLGSALSSVPHFPGKGRKAFCASISLLVKWEGWIP